MINSNHVKLDGATAGCRSIARNKHPPDVNFTCGVRNKFGPTFDTITRYLRYTGNEGFDQINPAEPDFNCGFPISVESSLNDENIKTSDEDNHVNIGENYRHRLSEFDPGQYTIFIHWNSQTIGLYL